MFANILSRSLNSNVGVVGSGVNASFLWLLLPSATVVAERFLHLSVILFTEGGVYLWVRGGMYTPLDRHPLDRHPPKQTPLGRHLRQTPPWADIPWDWFSSVMASVTDSDAWCGLYRYKLMWSITSVDAATAADARCVHSLSRHSQADTPLGWPLQQTVCSWWWWIILLLFMFCCCCWLLLLLVVVVVSCCC